MNNYSRIEDDSAERAFNSMGLVRRGHTLIWGFRHGHLRWLPHWFRNLLITVWNWLACRIWDHDRTMLELRAWIEENEENRTAWEELHKETNGRITGFPLPEPMCGDCGKKLGKKSSAV